MPRKGQRKCRNSEVFFGMDECQLWRDHEGEHIGVNSHESDMCKEHKCHFMTCLHRHD